MAMTIVVMKEENDEKQEHEIPPEGSCKQQRP